MESATREPLGNHPDDFDMDSEDSEKAARRKK
jgi:hypothetical protein